MAMLPPEMLRTELSPMPPRRPSATDDNPAPLGDRNSSFASSTTAGTPSYPPPRGPTPSATNAGPQTPGSLFALMSPSRSLRTTLPVDVTSTGGTTPPLRDDSINPHARGSFPLPFALRRPSAGAESLPGDGQEAARLFVGDPVLDPAEGDDPYHLSGSGRRDGDDDPGDTMGIGASATVRMMALEDRDEVIAVKTIRETTEDKIRAAEREFRYVERLNEHPELQCPNLVRVLEIAASKERRETLIAMECVPCGSVGTLPALQLLRSEKSSSAGSPMGASPTSTRQRLDASRATDWACSHAVAEMALARVARDALTGLSTLHGTLGVLHRDITPRNLLVATDGTVKIIDFGMCSLTLEASDQVGSIAYMAPERLRGEVHGPPSDVWSLGVVLLELALGGRHPFLDPSPPRTDVLSTPVASGDDQPLPSEPSAGADRFWALATVLGATGTTEECTAAVHAAVESAIAAAGLSNAFGAFVRRLLAAEPEQRASTDSLLCDEWIETASSQI